MEVMALQFEQKSYADSQSSRLFFALAEQLKLPLLQIARTAELAQSSKSVKSYKSIEDIADTTLQIIDSYMLNNELQQVADEIILEPVSLAATLLDVAHKIQAMADKSNCDLELHIAGKYGPVMAHPLALQTALINLGQVFVIAQSERSHTKRPVVKLAAHRTARGITAGLFTDLEGLNNDMLKAAKKMYGRAKQPLSQMSSSNGVGVFIADALLSNMSSGLRVAHHQKLTGLAATFLPSQQLALV